MEKAHAEQFVVKKRAEFPVESVWSTKAFTVMEWEVQNTVFLVAQRLVHISFCTRQIAKHAPRAAYISPPPILGLRAPLTPIVGKTGALGIRGGGEPRLP